MTDLPIIVPQEWMSRGACRDLPTEWFFPTRELRLGRRNAKAPSIFTVEVERAKRICEGCPVIGECRQYTIDDPSISGIWGGLTDAERSQIRRTRRRLGDKRYLPSQWDRLRGAS